MDTTKYFIDAVLKEGTRTTANGYYHFITIPQQQLLNNLKNMDTIIFKILKKLVEINGGYYKVKNNVYRNIKTDTIVILKNKDTRLSQPLLDTVV